MLRSERQFDSSRRGRTRLSVAGDGMLCELLLAGLALSRRNGGPKVPRCWTGIDSAWTRPGSRGRRYGFSECIEIGRESSDACLKLPLSISVSLIETHANHAKSFRRGMSVARVVRSLSDPPAHTAASSGCGWKGRSRLYSWVSGKLVERCRAKGGALARLFRDGRKVNMGGRGGPRREWFLGWGVYPLFR